MQDHFPRRAHPLFHPAPLALAALLALAAPHTVRAQAADGRAVTLSIAAQPLGSALNELSAATGTPIGFSPALVAARTACPAQGRLTLRQAVDRLLAASGLIAVQEGSGLVIKAGPAPSTGEATALPTVMVTAQAERDGTTEGTGSYTQRGPSATATGLPLTLRETPQSVSVMTRQRMDDFKLETLTDVMEQTPGLTVDRQGDGNNFLVRGSDVNLQVDGLRQMKSGWYTDSQKLYSMDDMVEFDRIEVLKGSSGLMNGDGKYGATVNMIRKRAPRDFQAGVSAGAGSWDNYRASVDLGGPLNASGSVRGRIVAAAADGKDFRDHARRSNQTLFGTLDVDLAPDTLLNLGFTYRHRDYYGAGDTAMIQAYAADGRYLGLQPRSFNVGAPWSGYEQDTRTLFANLEHRFASGWTARLRATDEKTETPYGEIGIWWTAVPQAVDVSWMRDYVNRNRSIALDLQGPFKLFGRQHELMLGADAARTSSNAYSGGTRFSDLVLDYAGGGGAIARPADLADYPMDNHSYFSSRRNSFYAAGRFNLADPVKLIAGARVTDYQQYDLTPYSSSNNDFRKKGVVTPYAGLVVDVHENVSLYGSYASIFRPQSAIDAQRKTLDPEEGKTWEVGTKGEFFDKRLNASLAYFWMKTDNVAERTGESTTDGLAIYRAVSGVSRRGYELELSGELAPGWQAQGGYTMNSSSLGSNDYLPKSQFKLATTYQLGGAWDGLTLGAATRWQSRTSAGALQQPSFWIVDLMARYRVNRQLSFNVNVRNLLDKSYFAGMRDFGRIQYTWGAPRSVNVGMRYDF